MFRRCGIVLGTILHREHDILTAQFADDRGDVVFLEEADSGDAGRSGVKAGGGV